MPHRSQGVGYGRDENPGGFAGAGLAGESLAAIDTGGTRGPETLGGQVRGQRRELFEEWDQCGWAASALNKFTVEGLKFKVEKILLQVPSPPQHPRHCAAALHHHL